VLILADGRALYGESKIGNIFISNYFAKTHADVLVSCALHPGGIRTELQRCGLFSCCCPPSELRTLAVDMRRAGSKSSRTIYSSLPRTCRCPF
jgi:hypothetical protein